MKESCSLVPQDINRHFIEPNHRKENQKIYIKQYEEEEEDSEEDSETLYDKPASFVKGLLSKFQSNTTTPQDDHARSLSMYGVLVNRKRIGEGVSATVQLIQGESDLFAVKIFRKKKRRESVSGYMKALTSEFCISSALKHPNIVETLDFVRLDEDQTRYCIVMEYVRISIFIYIFQKKITNTYIYIYKVSRR